MLLKTFCRTFLKLMPKLFAGAVQGLVVQFICTASGQYYDINALQMALLHSECFPNDTLYAIALDSQTHIFFGDNQSPSGMVSAIAVGEKQQFRGGDL